MIDYSVSDLVLADENSIYNEFCNHEIVEAKVNIKMVKSKNIKITRFKSKTKTKNFEIPFLAKS